MDKFEVTIAGVLLVFGITGIVAYNLHKQSMSPAEQAGQYRKNLQVAEAAAIARRLKNSMRDPDSFALSSVRLMEKSEAICFEYRARNGYGGMNVGHAALSTTEKFKTDEMPGFVSLWNSDCAHKAGTEVSDTVQFLMNHPGTVN